MRVLLTEEEVRARVRALAARLDNLFRDSPDLVLVGILRGAVYFLADLSRAMHVPHRIDWVEYASYAGTSKRAGTVVKGCSDSVIGSDVVLVDEVFDIRRDASHPARHASSKWRLVALPLVFSWSSMMGANSLSPTCAAFTSALSSWSATGWTTISTTGVYRLSRCLRRVRRRGAPGFGPTPQGDRRGPGLHRRSGPGLCSGSRCSADAPLPPLHQAAAEPAHVPTDRARGTLSAATRSRRSRISHLQIDAALARRLAIDRVGYLLSKAISEPNGTIEAC